MKKSVLLMICTLVLAACSGKELRKLHVEGNRLADPDGNTVILRGVSCSSPRWLENHGHWDLRYFQEAKDWGCNVLRFPIHPIEARNDWEGNMKLIDKGVEYAKELGMYVIIDWHSIGNLYSGILCGGYETDYEETLRFWKDIATRYKDEPTVVMYELFNEPTTGDAGELGECTWHDWRLFMEQLIDEIRKIDPEKICLVAGLDWAYELDTICGDLVQRDNIAYACHPYPAKAMLPWPDHWDYDWGCLAEYAPIVCTEIGWVTTKEGGFNPCETNEPYGQILTDYMESKGISFTAWCFDFDWGPRLFCDWDFTPSVEGEFFKSYLQQFK